MTDSPVPYLEHICDACTLIESFINGISVDEFKDNKEKQSAVIRQIEIIGEAVRHIPEDIRNNSPEVPWRLVSSMRNFLIHEYFEVDLDLVWDTATSEVPQFKNTIEKMISQLQKKTFYGDT